MPNLVDLVINNQYMSTLDTSRNVKPDKPKGHLVKIPFYKAPFVYIEDLARDTYGIAKGWRGEANDHEIGKQNDIGMKIGGLAIAAYLATRQISKLPKIKEFIGLGAFFASLSLWPKLAIALPLKLRTGVDIQQKYVDSYGRKKNFFQDPQYLAWDLYSNDQIQKMGKKMGVPMDVPNRDEVIKEKARKLAVQGNTLWTATAGFASPIMAGLITKGLEPVAENLRMKYDLRQAEKIISGRAPLPLYKEQEKAFESFLTENMGKRIRVNDELISKFNWSSVISPNMPKALRKDLTNLLSGAANDVDMGYVDLLYSRLGNALSRAGITKEEIVEAFRKNDVFGNQLKIGDKEGLVVRYCANNPGSSSSSLTGITSEIINGLVKSKNLSGKAARLAKKELSADRINDIVNEHNIRILDDKTANQLRKVFHSLSEYFRREIALKKWETTLYTQDADSLTTYTWKKTAKTLLSALNLSSKELKAMTLEGAKPAEILDAKLTEIAADPKRYKKVMSKIANIIAEYDSVFNEGTRSRYRHFVNTMCQSAKKGLEQLGFSATARDIGGGELVKDAAGNILNYREAMDGSLQNLRHILYDEKVLSQRATMYRLIQALNLKRSMQAPEGGISYFEKLFDMVRSNDPHSRSEYPKVLKKTMQTIFDAIAGTHECKLGAEGTDTYKAVIRMLYGALPESFIKNRLMDLTNNANEVGAAINIEDIYKAALNNGVGKDEIDALRMGLMPETIEILNEASDKMNVSRNLTGNNKLDLLANLKKYFQTFIDKVVNADSELVKGYNLTEHNVKGAMEGLPEKVSPSLHKSLIGARPVDVVVDAAREMFTGRKWLKRFGIAGAVILVGTVIATTFFGHIPEKEMYMRESKKGTNGKKAV